MVTKEEVLKELKEIIDPHTQMNIVDMGLVQEIEINEDQKRIYVKFKPTTPFCPITKFFDTRIRDIISAMGYDPEVEIVLD